VIDAAKVLDRATQHSADRVGLINTCRAKYPLHNRAVGGPYSAERQVGWAHRFYGDFHG